MALPIADSDGTTFLAALNAELTTLKTQNAGNARPADAAAGTIWVDKNTPSATVWTIYGYDGSGDTVLGYWDTTNDFFTPANVMLSEAMKGHITGLTYANNGSDATNDIDIAAGWCMDATSVIQIEVAALTKRLDAAWAVGTNQGGLDTGSIGNSDYYIWAIYRSDTSVSDILFSLSSTSPTMPANYDYKRLIGWFRRESAAITPFTTLELPGGGLLFKWTTPTMDKNVSTLSTTRITDAIRGPVAFRTRALMRVMMVRVASGAIGIVCDPGETDAAPSLTAAPGATHACAGANLSDTKDMQIWTSATGTIAARADAASTIYRFWTLGFEWSRR